MQIVISNSQFGCSRKRSARLVFEHQFDAIWPRWKQLRGLKIATKLLKNYV